MSMSKTQRFQTLTGKAELKWTDTLVTWANLFTINQKRTMWYRKNTSADEFPYILSEITKNHKIILSEVRKIRELKSR